jgi:glycine dehydrogenase subunit 1
LGPQGIQELGETIMQNSAYAMQRLDQIPGVRAPRLASAHFKEFAVCFERTNKSVAEINHGLRERDIFGGKDLSAEFPELGKSALLCVTEVHTRSDIERLAGALEEVVR